MDLGVGLCHAMVLSRLLYMVRYFFFFNDTATTEIYTLSLHDALPISTLGPDPRWDSVKEASRSTLRPASTTLRSWVERSSHSLQSGPDRSTKEEGPRGFG